MSTSSPRKALNIKNINPHILKAQYAVRGELAQRSEVCRQQLAAGDAKLPFDSVISANIGNPQQLGQKPITFFRCSRESEGSPEGGGALQSLLKLVTDTPRTLAISS
ncbi:unnamed protein product [Tuber melanosporum]|uniref:(Perigord truffle) hypothetical protein n=1 Tax=Tuber melanosporum (strain Mel28) TaxID=656061 RepID=D5GFS6_TUBMM|nr:uncharacterized protein GSTUM_00007052001 [Tuber melanosporum]CAZ83369.1 unnamed protein product [Tuber melanosporum]